MTAEVYRPCASVLLIIDICHVTLAAQRSISGSAPLHCRMAMLDNLTLARLNACCPDLTIIQVFRFISLTIKLKDDIILVQPSSVPVSEPPEILPPTAMVFLQRSCNMTEEYVINCWNVLKLIIWYEAGQFDSNCEDYFVQNGHSLGLCMSIISIGQSRMLMSVLRFANVVPTSTLMSKSILPS